MKVLFIFIAAASVFLTVSSEVAVKESSVKSDESASLSEQDKCDDDDKCPNRNERWVECPPTLCVPSTCDDLGKPLPCPRILPGKCPRKPACVCNDGFVRNKKGVCIPINKCPSCGGDPNAESGCGFQCGRKCGANGPTQNFCKLCGINACQCKSGFVYDDNLKKCVRPAGCTKPCPLNEVYSACANGGCGKWNCTQIDEPILCRDPIKCTGGCICKEGYLRGKKGKCIPQNQCQRDLCPNPKEVYEPCPLACPGRTCKVNPILVLCQADQPCEPASCICKEGTFRTDDGDCVPWEQCPQAKTEGEVSANSEECPSNLDQSLIDANAKFTGLFLHNSLKSQPGENLIMSAFSVFTPISQLAYFSQGETLRQFLSVLNLPSKEYIKCVFPPLLEKLSSEKEVILNLAVRIFATDSYPLTKNFLDYSGKVFNAVPESLDFSNGQASADRINEWVANSTNNRIKDIANPSMFSGDTRLVLANAIYYLGNWIHQFKADDTEDREFYPSKDETVKIPTMYQQNSFKYAHSSKLNAQVLELFYKGGNFSFVILLPDEKDGLGKLVEQVQDPVTFYEAYDSSNYEKVRVFLPKIKVESRFNLNEVMEKAGMTDVFNIGKSNLTDILQVYEPLAISSAVQKAFILVDEKGTEAAAANVFVVGTTSAVLDPPKIYTVKCDHPFAFYIMHGRVPIFSGAFVKPTAS